MSTVSTLLPATRPPADVELRLNKLSERKVLAPARRAGYELRLAGATVLPQRQVIVHTPHGKWLFVDHLEDPTAKGYNGKIPIPAEQHARLVALDRAGVRPDVVWLGHQLSNWYREDQPLPQLVPSPRELREKDEPLTQRLRRGKELLLKGSGAVLTIAAAAPIMAAGAVASLRAGLDPHPRRRQASGLPGRAVGSAGSVGVGVVSHDVNRSRSEFPRR